MNPSDDFYVRHFKEPCGPQSRAFRVLAHLLVAEAIAAWRQGADSEDGAQNADIGRTYLLNYVVFAPYYCEGVADVRDIIATIRGKPGI